MVEAPSAPAGKLPTGQRTTAKGSADEDIEEMLAKRFVFFPEGRRVEGVENLFVFLFVCTYRQTKTSHRV